MSQRVLMKWLFLFLQQKHLPRKQRKCTFATITCSRRANWNFCALRWTTRALRKATTTKAIGASSCANCEPVRLLKVGPATQKSHFSKNSSLWRTSSPQQSAGGDSHFASRDRVRGTARLPLSHLDVNFASRVWCKFPLRRLRGAAALSAPRAVIPRRRRRHWT